MSSARSTAQELERALQVLGNPARAKVSARFFKTGPGEYGEGDRFLGVPVPEQRKLAKRFIDLPLSEIERLLANPFHECRLTALLILVFQYERGTMSERERIAKFYLRNAGHANNWDLVDSSAPRILGVHLVGKNSDILRRLSRSSNLWERRIAIVATLAFIAHGEFDETLVIARAYFTDRHDLIQKASGWMLREVGKRSRSTLTTFLDQEASRMPRTMLRYSIEHYPKSRRMTYLRAK